MTLPVGSLAYAGCRTRRWPSSGEPVSRRRPIISSCSSSDTRSQNSTSMRMIRTTWKLPRAAQGACRAVVNTKLVGVGRVVSQRVGGAVLEGSRLRVVPPAFSLLGGLNPSIFQRTANARRCRGGSPAGRGGRCRGCARRSATTDRRGPGPGRSRRWGTPAWAPGRPASGWSDRSDRRTATSPTPRVMVRASGTTAGRGRRSRRRHIPGDDRGHPTSGEKTSPCGYRAQSVSQVGPAGGHAVQGGVDGRSGCGVTIPAWCDPSKAHHVVGVGDRDPVEVRDGDGGPGGRPGREIHHAAAAQDRAAGQGTPQQRPPGDPPVRRPGRAGRVSLGH